MPKSEFRIVEYERLIGTPASIANYILIGSDARAERDPKVGGDSEAIFIDSDGDIQDISNEGQLVPTGLNIYSLERPELVLEAWTEHPHFMSILSSAKKFLLSPDRLPSTVNCLTSSLRSAERSMESGIYSFGGDEYVQHETNSEDIMTFLYGKNQFGPKYSFLRYVQLASLLGVIDTGNTNLDSFFVNRPTIKNRLKYLLDWDVIDTNTKSRVLSMYQTLSNSYQKRQPVQLRYEDVIQGIKLV